jgi:phosphatidylserine decarboxylase
MGWYGRLRSRALTRLSIAAWRLLDPDLDLGEARQTTFRSLNECFIRQLQDGARPIHPDPEILTSPCDAIVGAHGRVRGTEAIQAKGFPYTLEDLLGDPELVERYRDGTFVTLRLKSSFYHRFHAPCDALLRRVIYISGDTWNVNPIALKRVEKLFCKNERAVLDLDVGIPGQSVAIVAVAAICVASIRLHAIGPTLDLRYRGPNHIACDARYAKGDELGYFQAGSTLLVFATPGFELCDTVRDQTLLRVGRPLLRRPRHAPAPERPPPAG